MKSIKSKKNSGLKDSNRKNKNGNQKSYKKSYKTLSKALSHKLIEQCLAADLKYPKYNKNTRP